MSITFSDRRRESPISPEAQRERVVNLVLTNFRVRGNLLSFCFLHRPMLYDAVASEIEGTCVRLRLSLKSVKRTINELVSLY